MSKYIIEIAEEYEEYFKGVLICGIADGKFAVDVIAREDLEELNSDYINEHYGQMQDEAYQKGINDGSLDVKQRVEGAYQRGLEDAWDVVRKIAMETDDGGLCIAALYELFGTESMCAIAKNNTVYEAIDKLKAFEEKDNDSIKVGDIVDVYGNLGVVTYVYENAFNVMMYDGSTGDWKREDLKKTGKHYDIASILEAMRE